MCFAVFETERADFQVSNLLMSQKYWQHQVAEKSDSGVVHTFRVVTRFLLQAVPPAVS